MSDSDKINSIETKNINKVNGIEGKNISHMGGSVIKFAPAVPAGLIMFLNDTSIPTDWERFTAADNKMIIGAGNSYSIADTGGSNNLYNYNLDSGSSGAHTGSGNFRCGGATYQYVFGSWNYGAGTLYTPVHTHHGNNLTFIPDKRTCVMIKAQKEMETLPPNVICPSRASLSGLSNITTFNDRYFQSSTSIANINQSSSLPLSTAGNHGHGYFVWNPNTNIGGSTYLSSLYQMTGNHTPAALSPTSVTDNLKKLLVSLWTNASQNFEPGNGVIGMWESLTPPDGWAICDGTNGTPDLRDSFIKPVASGSEGSSSIGDNTMTWSMPSTISHSQSHTHYGTEYGTSYSQLNNGHSSVESWSHSHSNPFTGKSNISWLPPYYALSFIMKS